MSMLYCYNLRLEIKDCIGNDNLEELKKLAKNNDLNKFINEIDGWIWTPLHVAISIGNLEIFTWLIDNYDFSCSVNKRSVWGKTLLHFAVEKNNIEVVKCLLEKYSN